MIVPLAYGRSGLDLAVPDDLADRVTVVEPRYVPGVPDEAAALRAALREPVGTPPLRDLLSPTDTVAVVFCDITRPMPSDRVLPVLLEEVETVVGRDRIVLINGTGTHRANTPDELREMLGPELVAQYRIVQHDARNEDESGPRRHHAARDAGVDQQALSERLGAPAHRLHRAAPVRRVQRWPENGSAGGGGPRYRHGQPRRPLHRRAAGDLGHPRGQPAVGRPTRGGHDGAADLQPQRGTEQGARDHGRLCWRHAGLAPRRLRVGRRARDAAGPGAVRRGSHHQQRLSARSQRIPGNQRRLGSEPRRARGRGDHPGRGMLGRYSQPRSVRRACWRAPRVSTSCCRRFARPALRCRISGRRKYRPKYSCAPRSISTRRSTTTRCAGRTWSRVGRSPSGLPRCCGRRGRTRPPVSCRRDRRPSPTSRPTPAKARGHGS